MYRYRRLLEDTSVIFKNSMGVGDSLYFLHHCLVRLFQFLGFPWSISRAESVLSWKKLFLTKKTWSGPAISYILYEFIFENFIHGFMRVLTQGQSLNREITRFLLPKSLYISIKVGNFRAFLIQIYDSRTQAIFLVVFCSEYSNLV